MNIVKLDQVVQLFRRQQASGAFPGGQLVLMQGGKTLLNEAVGLARGFRFSEPQPPIPSQPATPFPVLSAGKPLAAIVIALLEDRGLLDVHAPVAQVFPEFARHGKEQITTMDVLTHRSGLLMPDFVRQPHLWGDRDAVRQALIDAVPVYPRGTQAYHPYEYGWILSEIVQRIDGRTLPTFFHEEIALPLHLPDLRFGLGDRDPQSVGFIYWLGKAKVIVAGINVAENFEQQNSALYLDAQNPATSLVCNAGSLAAFYDWLLHGDKSPAGPVPLQQSTLRKYTTRQVGGYDRSLRTPISMGRGFVVGTIIPSTFGWWNTVGCFGHAGGFCSLAFGDYRTGIAAAIVTNGNRGMSDLLWHILPLVQGLRAAARP